MVVIACVEAALIFTPRQKIERFHLHFEDDSLPPPVVALINSVGIEILVTLPKIISMNFEDTLLGGISGRKFPLTVKGLNRNLTFVIDFYGQPKVGVVHVSWLNDLNGVNPNVAADSRLRLGNTECMSLTHNPQLEAPDSELKPAEASGNQYTDKAHSDSTSDSVEGT
jgi:hypothetical protein